MISSVEEFRAFIAEHGFEPPSRIEPGRFFRFPTNGKSGDSAGWAKLFPDLKGGIIGDFRGDQTWTWRAKRDRPFTETETRSWRERVEHEQREAQALREREEKEAAQRALAIWDQAQPAPSTHAYLVAKRVQAHGLRVYRGPVAVNGMRCDGALIVPVRNAAGEIQSIEFIAPDGEKRFLPRGRKAGGYHAIGTPSDTICLAEGYATAASVYEATGCMTVCAFDCGNLLAVGRTIREGYAEARIIFCADDDYRTEGNPGQSNATEAARAIGALLAVPDFGVDRPDGAKDFNDLARKSGAEAVARAVRDAKPPAAPEAWANAPEPGKWPEPLPLPAAASRPHVEASNASGLVLTCIADVEAKPIRWLWSGRIARGKVTLLAGHPGLGKSQLTLSLAATVSTGGQWPVDRTGCEHGSVILLNAEDDVADTIRPRLEAAGADLNRVHVLDAVRVANERGETHLRSFSLADDVDRLGALLDKLPDVVLIVIDPISAYLGGADSHNNAEIRALLAPLAEMAARHGVAVVCVSHLNKSAGSEALLRVQGSIAFGAAARAVWGVARDKDNAARRLFLPLKNNLGNDQTGLAFAVEGYRLPGGIETSRVVWEGEPVTVTAEEAFAPAQQSEERGEMDDAKDFLRGLLAGGEVPSKQIRADAEGAGHAWRTIQRAQKSLGIEAVKSSMAGGWVWRLAGYSHHEDRQETPKNATQNVWQPSHSSGDVGGLRGNEAGPVEVEV